MILNGYEGRRDPKQAKAARAAAAAEPREWMAGEGEGEGGEGEGGEGFDGCYKGKGGEG